MAKRQKKVKASILYEGPSMLDGKPIVVIGIPDSSNSKTGGLIATYILLQNVSPIEATRDGQDRSICGDCKHRGNKGDIKSGILPFDTTPVSRSCYVQTAQAPLGIWKKYKGMMKNTYPVAADLAAYGKGMLVRLGAYGDPAAVPVAIWNALLTDSKGSVGYTHQWKTHKHLSTMCMASVDNEAELCEAEADGWRAFRVTADEGDIDSQLEILCPASKEAGQLKTCSTCMLCSGTKVKGKSVAIPAHGGLGIMWALQSAGKVPTQGRRGDIQVSTADLAVDGPRMAGPR